MNQDHLSIAQATLLEPSGLSDTHLQQLMRKLTNVDGSDFADLYFQYSKHESWSLDEGQVKTGSFNIDQGVGVITLNRPDALNALSEQLMLDVVAVLSEYELDDSVGAILLTGNEKAFAAGADIKEMVDQDYRTAMSNQFLGGWDRLAQCRKPTIAAVAGYALGGGCEIAMMCDIILAADNAQFGQPEIKLGTMHHSIES